MTKMYKPHASISSTSSTPIHRNTFSNKRYTHTPIGLSTRFHYFFSNLWFDIEVLKKITQYIVYFLIFYTLVSALYYTFQRPIFYIPHIKMVTSCLEIPEKQKQKIMQELGKPVHFFQPMESFANIFTEVSAIQSIRYQRNFNSLTNPEKNSFLIILQKHQPLAKWDQDDYSYISTQGLIYQDFSMPKTQLQLSGDEAPNALFKMIQNQAVFSKILAPFNIKKIDFKFNIWRIELNQGLSLSFSDEPIDDIKNKIERWKIVWNFWQKNNSPYKNAVDFDLRQSNGFSFKDVDLTSHSAKPLDSEN